MNSLSAPIVSSSLLQSLAGIEKVPHFIVPVCVLESGWFQKLKPRQQDYVAAYLFITFRACLWKHVQEMRASADMNPKRERILRQQKYLQSAKVSQERLQQLIEKNQQCGILDLLVTRQILNVDSEGIHKISAKVLSFTRRACRSGFTFFRPQTAAFRRKLAIPKLINRRDGVTDTERNALRELQRITIDVNGVLADPLTQDLSFVQELALVDSLLSFATGTPFLVRDDFSGRTHSSLTNLKKQFRQYLHVDGVELVECDLPAAQPLLLANYSDSVYSDWSVREFGELVSTGKLYSHLAQVDSIAVKLKRYMPHLTPEKAAKAAFLTFLFYDFRKIKKPPCAPVIDEYMKERFPTIWRVVRELKKADHRTAAKTLQKLEVAIVVDGVLPTLMSRGFAASIHDCVVVKRGDEELAKNMLRSAFSGHIFKPNL